MYYKHFVAPLLIGVLLIGSSVATQAKTQGTVLHQTGQDTSEIALVDHHAHIFSPRVREYLVAHIDRLDSLPPLGIKKLQKVVHKDHVQQVALLSNAYFFSDSGSTSTEELETVRAENDRIAQVVANYSPKYIGFFSVNPLSNTASKEIERNASRPEFAGLKLHLANSGVNLRNKQHVQQLAHIFKMANTLGLGIVIHLRTQEAPYGSKDARIFIKKVLSQAPDVPIQIAHLAGWGGYDQSTHKALQVFAEKISNGLLQNVYFDVSAIVRPASEDKSKKTPDWYPDKRYSVLANVIRKIGMDRIFFGTDWPDWSPADYRSDLKQKLPLSDQELKTIFSNQAPWFKTDKATHDEK